MFFCPVSRRAPPTLPRPLTIQRARPFSWPALCLAVRLTVRSAVCPPPRHEIRCAGAIRAGRLAGVRTEGPDAARYVDFRSFDMDTLAGPAYHECWDIASALHPQTLVVYGMDGRLLTPAHGAPARVHSPVKLGYKNTKYLTEVVFQRDRTGGYWSDRGYEWYGVT